MEKNDSVVQVWCRRTTLANLLLGITENGSSVRSVGELVRVGLEMMEEVLKMNGLQGVEDVAEAEEVLKAFRIENLNPSGRAKRNLMKNLQVTQLKNLGYSGEAIIEKMKRRRVRENINYEELIRTELPKVKEEVERLEDQKELVEEEDHSIPSLKSALARVPEGLVVPKSED